MDLNVNFVPKEITPPNVPQARPSGNFWDCLAETFTREANTEQQLIRRIECKMK